MSVELIIKNRNKSTDKAIIIREVTIKTERIINRRIQESEAKKKNA